MAGSIDTSEQRHFEVRALSDCVGAEILGVDIAAGIEDRTFIALHCVVVIRHPDSGRKALYVNPGFTVAVDGLSDQASRELLEALYAAFTEPRHVCRVTWSKHSLAIWDNRATWHRAMNDYPGERRLMHRITLEGVPLQAA